MGPIHFGMGRAILLAAVLVGASGMTAAYAEPVPAQKEAAAKSQSPKRAFLGVKLQQIDRDAADALGLSEAKGALVTEVLPGSPAEKAGLKAADAILSLNGQSISDAKDFAQQISDLSPKSAIEISIRRGAADQKLKIELGETDTNREAANDAKELPAAPKALRLGLSLTDDAAADGVVISGVDPQSDAAAKGLQTGDVIVQVDGAPAQTAQEAAEMLNRAKTMGKAAVLLQVKSGDDVRTVAVRFSTLG